MGKQPYIPLYIGDWLKDTDIISLEAEAALLRLVFKLWDSEDRGKLKISFDQLTRIFKKGRDLTDKILTELHENKVLNIEFLDENFVKIESRRMLKDRAKHDSASERGKKGAEERKRRKEAENQLPFSLSQTQANSDIDSDSISNNKKDLREIFFDDLPNSKKLETIGKDLGTTKEILISLIPEFRKFAEPTYPSFDRFTSHFKNWSRGKLKNQATEVSPTKKRNPLIK